MHQVCEQRAPVLLYLVAMGRTGWPDAEPMWCQNFLDQPASGMLPAAACHRQHGPRDYCALIFFPCASVHRWQERGYFRPKDDATGEPFVISMPPPNVTGKLHMGHAMFATLQVGVLKGCLLHSNHAGTAAAG